MRTLEQLIKDVEATGHAVCAPSKAAQWMNCPASIRVIEACGAKDEPNAAALDGTMKHSWLEKLFKGECEPTDIPEDHAEAVVSAYNMITGCLSEATVFKAEQHLSCYVGAWMLRNDGSHAPAMTNLCHGSTDLIAFDYLTDTLWIFDAKFGRVSVSPDALQLKCYAVGGVAWCSVSMFPYCEENNNTDASNGDTIIGWKNVKHIKLAIAQPFVSSKIQIFKMSPEDVKAFGATLEDALEKVIEAYKGNDPCIPGDAQCAWCRAKNTCSYYEQWLLGNPTDMEPPSPEALAEVGLSPLPELTAGSTLSVAYAYWKELKKWGEQVEELFAARLRAADGEEIDGFVMKKLRSGAAKWINDDPEHIARELGVNILDIMKLDSPSAIAKRTKLDLSALIIEGEPVMGIKELLS